jgi:hypothetical protein
MNRWLLVVALAAVGCGKSKSGGGDAPAPVRAAARALVGSDARVHREGSIYEAAGTTRLEVELGADGTVRATEVPLPLAAVPTAVRAAAQKTFPDASAIRESELVVTPAGVRSEIEGKAASGKEVEIALDEQGHAVTGADDEEEGAGDEADADGH